MRSQLIAITGARALLLPLATSATADVAGPVAVTTGGLVQGTTTAAVEQFSAIPYAAPPTGALRWRSPVQPRPWAGVRDATKAPASCVQLSGAEQLAGSSEDCLYLNVTRPRGGAKLRPVMVWVHGGGNTIGSGHEFDPARMAERGDVVVVTINYRLGSFGFFAHPGLADSGSFGLQDQQAALRWVRRNALLFGGNPANVTLFGESAGGVDTCAQLTSPGALGLFDRAILQSGSCRMGVPSFAVPGGPVTTLPGEGQFLPISTTRAAGRRIGATLADGACAEAEDRLTCLRRLPAAEVVQVTGEFSRPSTGTRTLPLAPADALEAGRFHRTPILSGSNRDEATLTTMFAEYLSGRPIDATSYRALLRQYFGADAAAVEARYPAGDDPSVAFAAMDTDRVFACPQLATSRAVSRHAPVHAYEFSDRTTPTYNPFLVDIPPGAAHASELAYLFDLRSPGPYRGLQPVELNADQRRLGDRMIDYWTTFARTGRPNGADWPRYTTRTPHVQALTTTGERRTDAAIIHQCGFWNALSK